MYELTTPPEKTGTQREDEMRTRQVIGILLIVAGLVSLLWGGVSWTREKTVVDLGPIQATTRERKTFPIPPIAGGLLLAGGVALLLVGRKKV